VNTVIKLWGKKIAERTKSTFDDEVLPLIQSLSKIFVGIIVLLIVLDIWSIKIGPLLASLGIAGLAVAFAMQTSLGNIFGSISLILDKTFKVKDVIQLESGEIGQIVGIGLRSTKIKTFDNELLIVPNGMLATSKIKNLAKPNNVLRLVLPIGVAYGSDIDKVKKTLLTTLKNVKGVVHGNEKRKPLVRFNKMNDFSLDFDLVFFIEDYKERFDISDEILTKAYNELNKKKIDIPFPTRTVYLKK
jgi:MscS family membrane protein